MAYVLKLSDSSETDVVDFIGECVGDPWCQLEDNGLIIEQPEKNRLFAGSGASRRGLNLTSTLYKNRDIQITFEIGGSDRDTMVDMRNKINRILEDARESQASGLARPAFLEFQLDTMTKPVYLDVVDGSLRLPDEFMSVEGMGWIKCTTHKVLKGCVLALDCKPFARGDEVQLVSGASIDNEDGNNYASWSATNVKGDMPGPLRVQFTNSSGTDMSEWWLGMRDTGTPSTWTGVLEAENATTVVPSGGAQGNSNASGGQEREWVSITPSVEYDSPLCYWTIPSRNPMVNYGGKARAIAIGSFSSDLTYRLESSYLGITTLHSYKYRAASVIKYYLDLGTIDMNAWGVLQDQAADSWRLYFMVRNLSGFATSVVLDAIYLIPANDYKFRSWRFKGYNLGNGETVEDIGLYDQVTRGSSVKASLVDYKGLALHARPGNDGRLFFVWMNQSGYYQSGYSGTVRVWHTPYYFDLRGGSL